MYMIFQTPNQVGRVLLAHAIAGGARQGAAELAKEKTTTLSETLISMQVRWTSL